MLSLELTTSDPLICIIMQGDTRKLIISYYERYSLGHSVPGQVYGAFM